MKRTGERFHDRASMPRAVVTANLLLGVARTPHFFRVFARVRGQSFGFFPA